ncbi:MAG: hypothetical protein ABR530_03285 [Pyrinomonadaceae bacterium]
MIKNSLGIFASGLLLSVVLGCGVVDRIEKTVAGTENTNSNKTLTDKAVDTTVGEKKIGIPECDEVMDLITAEANNPEDNFVVKAGKSFFLNKIKESIVASIEEHKTDRVKLAKDCKDAKAELLKYKAQAEANSKQ